MSHQDRITATAPARLVRAGDGGDRGFVGRPGRLDRVPVAGGGEERLPHGRVLDEVEQVGGVAPQVRRRGGAQLAPQLPPGRDPVGAVGRRVVDPQQRRDDFAHGVVQDQAVRAELHERQRAQHVVGVVRGDVRQQGAEERHGRPAQRAGGVEHGPGRLAEAGQVDPGEFGDDGGDRRVGDREVGAGAPGGGGEPQRQRVAVGEADDPGGVGVAESFAAQQRAGVGGGQVRQRHRGQQVPEIPDPGGDGRLAAGQRQPGVVAQARHEFLPQPGVQQPELFVGIENQDHPVAEGAERGGGLGDGRHRPGPAGWSGPQRPDRAAERGEETALGRLDAAAVQADDGGAARSRVLGERGQQRGFPDPGDAVHGHDQRAVTLGQFEEHRPLRLPADHGGGPGGQQCSQGPAHRPSARAWCSYQRRCPPGGWPARFARADPGAQIRLTFGSSWLAARGLASGAGLIHPPSGGFSDEH